MAYTENDFATPVKVNGMVFDDEELKVKVTGINIVVSTLSLTLTNTDAILTTIDADTSALVATVSDGKILTTETNSAGIKVSADALAALISSGKLLVTETSAGATKTATEALAAIITTGKLGVLDTNSGAIKTAVEASKTAVEALKTATDTINDNISIIKDDIVASQFIGYRTEYDKTTTSGTEYFGYALSGSLTSASAWKIKKIVTGVGGNVSTTWANAGTSDQIWDDIVTLTYS